MEKELLESLIDAVDMLTALHDDPECLTYHTIEDLDIENYKNIIAKGLDKI